MSSLKEMHSSALLKHASDFTDDEGPITTAIVYLEVVELRRLRGALNG